MSLDVVLEIDLEQGIYSEFICEPAKEKKEELNCKYVSRLGKGESKPSILFFRTIKKNKN